MLPWGALNGRKCSLYQQKGKAGSAWTHRGAEGAGGWVKLPGADGLVLARAEQHIGAGRQCKHLCLVPGQIMLRPGRHVPHLQLQAA